MWDVVCLWSFPWLGMSLVFRLVFLGCVFFFLGVLWCVVADVRFYGPVSVDHMFCGVWVFCWNWFSGEHTVLVSAS